MVKFPHTATIAIPAPATLGTNGEYDFEIGSSDVTTECRAEGNPSGRFVTLSDGSQYLYSGVVYFATGLSSVSPGSQIEVVDGDGNLRLKGKIKAFQSEQKGVVIWV